MKVEVSFLFYGIECKRLTTLFRDVRMFQIGPRGRIFRRPTKRLNLVTITILSPKEQTMKLTRLTLVVLVLLAFAAIPGAASASVAPCTFGAAYDPACDVDHDSDIDVFDIQLTAGHWGQTGAYTNLPVPFQRTGQTTSYAAGDDGALQLGVAWPNPRFTNNFDGTVTDHLTGLVWLQHANCIGLTNWTGALNLANALYDGWTGAGGGDCGLSDGSVAGDWRLPNIRELYSLVDVRRFTPALPQPNPFTDVVVDGEYWSSTTTVTTTNAWVVGFDDGATVRKLKTGTVYALPVRGG